MSIMCTCGHSVSEHSYNRCRNISEGFFNNECTCSYSAEEVIKQHFFDEENLRKKV